MDDPTWRCPACLTDWSGRPPTGLRPRRCKTCHTLALGDDLYRDSDTGQIGILVHHQSGSASSTTWATFDDAGNLAFSGTDNGTQVEAFFLATEYEYYLMIPAEDVDELRAAVAADDEPEDPADVLIALKEAVTTEDGAPRLASWLDRHSITYELTSFLS